MSLYTQLKTNAIKKGSLEKADKYLDRIFPYVELSSSRYGRLYVAVSDHFLK